VHRAIGTLENGGTTRFSFGPFLSKQDVKFATDVLAEISTSNVRPERSVTLP
jgi:cysteine desulfurase / selenocysteine lyase